MVESTMELSSWLRKQVEQASPDLLRAMVKALVDQLRAVYQAGDGKGAMLLLDEWLRAALASVLVPFIRVAHTLAEHRDGIVNAIALGLSNARLETMNSTVRLISPRSRGFRRLDSLLAMIRLVCGKVPVALPT